MRDHARICFIASSIALVACGSSGEGGTSTADDPSQEATAGETPEAPPPPSSLGDQADTPEDTGPAPKVVFYANTDTTLYRLDPYDLKKPMEKVGDFDCVGADGDTRVMTDVAVDKTGKVYGVSPAAAFPLAIQADGVVHCETKWPLAAGTHFNGLTFAPEGTVDKNEVLIGGNAAGDLYRIDAGTGVATQIGTLGSDPETGLPWTVSGDMVFLANNGDPIGFATVRTCESPPSKCSFTDRLLQIDVAALKPGKQTVGKAVRGSITRGSSCGGSTTYGSYGSIFGIVAFQDKVYGFSRHGDFLDVSNDTGTGCVVWTDTTTKFAGAGITTVAPVTAPPAPR